VLHQDLILGTNRTRDHTGVGLARTIYIRCTYGIFGLEITKYTVYIYVYIRFWPTLHWSHEKTPALLQCRARGAALRAGIGHKQNLKHTHTHTHTQARHTHRHDTDTHARYTHRHDRHTHTHIHTHTHSHTHTHTHTHLDKSTCNGPACPPPIAVRTYTCIRTCVTKSHVQTSHHLSIGDFSAQININK